MVDPILVLAWSVIFLMSVFILIWCFCRRLDNAYDVALLLAARDGILANDGWIDFADKSLNLPPLRVDQEQRLMPGPVLVLPRQHPNVSQGRPQGPRSPYRDTTQAGHGEIICGHFVDLILPLQREMLVWRRLALVLLATMPFHAAIAMQCVDGLRLCEELELDGEGVTYRADDEPSCGLLAWKRIQQQRSDHPW